MIVGLSGGVDSAVAALLLRDQGMTVRTATLELWPEPDERSCCSPQAVLRAARVARELGLAHDRVGAEDEFEASVVEPFVAAYLAGDTPNPCVECNPRRLSWLQRVAGRVGAAHIATGHYARIVRRDGHAFVARGADRAKDQSYMLWRVAGDMLGRLLLPLGELDKDEVRARAVRAGLSVAAQPESQEVCFAPDDYREFVAARGLRARDGDIVDLRGAVVGRHEGFWRYTVGQRRGLGIAAPEPLYVVAVDASRNEVVVGRRVDLAADVVEVREFVDYGLGDDEGLEVQLRYKAGAVGVRRLRRLSADRARIELSQPFEGPAPGQSAVFYRDDLVVGGGIICRASGTPWRAGRL